MPPSHKSIANPLFKYALKIQRIVVFSCFVIYCPSAQSQNFSLQLIVADSMSQDILPKEEQTYFSAIEARKALLAFRTDLYSMGYLANSIDSVLEDSNSLKAHIYIGEQLKWVRLKPGNLPQAWKEDLRLSLGQFEDQKVVAGELVRLMKRILTYGENIGYPFVEVGLHQIVINEENGMSASLQVSPNLYFAMDTLTIEGDAKISKAFLYSYLGFKPGMPYSEKTITKISEKLRRLPFIQPDIRTKVFFSGNKVRVILQLKDRKTDQLDGIIGFAPNPVDNKLLITGEGNVDLKNLLKRGIAFDMHWKSFQQRSQQLKLGGTYPYILHKPMGLDARFEYVKFDTLFFTIHTLFGVRYMFRGTDYLKFYVGQNSSSLLSIDTTQIRVNEQIPDRNPVDSKSYGIELHLQNLDYVLNPRRGYRLTLDANVGSRKILKDIRIEQVIFRNSQNNEYDVYDSIDLATLQGQFAYSAQIFVPFKKKSTWVCSLSGRHLQAEKIFFNDLYRFGGAKSLRGFNEESLVASTYNMAAIEYRYLFNNSSYFQLFVNGAYTVKEINGVQTKDVPFGFGTGVSLEVKTGLLTLAYALGSEQGNPIRLADARIHFGIVNYL